MQSILKMIRVSRAVLAMVRNADQADRVFDLIEAMYASSDAAQKMVERMSRDPVIARALRERPRLGRVDLEALSRLPEGTLGRAFADQLREYGLDPNLLRVQEAPDAASYVKAHLFETHDLWHVVTGFRPDSAGELGLQSFYFAQNGSRVSMGVFVAGLVFTFLRRFELCEVMMPQVVRGWLLGRRARRLFGTDWKRLLDKPLEEVRAAFGLELGSVDTILRECETARLSVVTAHA
ncbi:Coq4 family protein [Archangium sp.]|uniref:Coq4 family protein n=1 Tax=Archangium sp. TaxID=1872627 RepID=UPI002D58E690|nr:Coq4 family protein [Archangium sp.]HYO57712.1 Coq4 family protein [Archangium sp.]